MSTRRPSNHPVPLGYQYGPQPAEPDSIWKLIHDVRCERGLRISEVSVLANVASATISRAERGYDARISTTRRVASALGIMIVAIPPKAVSGENIE